MKLITNIYRLISFLLRCSRGIRHSRIITTWIIATGVAAGLSATAFITLINYALHRLDSLSSSVTWGFITLCLFVPLTRTASQALLIRLTARSFFELRMRLSRQILSIPLRQLEELGTHRIMAVLTEDVPAIIVALTTLPTFCVDVTVVAGCLVYLGFLSSTVLLAVLAVMIFGIVMYQIPMSKSMYYFQLAREETDMMFRHYRAQVEGAKELKLHCGRRNAFYLKLESTTRRLQRYNVAGNIIAAAAANCGDLHFVFIGLMLFVTPKVLQLENQIILGYVLTILFMKAPLAEILNIIPGLNRATVAVQKVQALGLSLMTYPSEMESGVASNNKSSWKRLELVGITHAYRRDGEERDFILGPIDLTIHPGEIVFLIGGNGSGKTTLAKLLTGLYIPDSGEIRLDGKIITAQARDNYRQRFSAIFWDFYLFEGLLGQDGPAIDALVTDYLVKLQLDKKVTVENGVLSTIDLSQGQRKRLALLTAYLEDRSICLFDEWAADQDPAFKDVFYHQLLPELKKQGKTSVVITHDDRYYHLADRIIRLENGKCHPVPCSFDLAVPKASY
jgi:putative pyoverdin transport system ATP-binding/permease protein